MTKKCSMKLITLRMTRSKLRVKFLIESLNFNNVDENVDRRSFEGIYRLGKDGKPLNIKGRTGVVGRGILGKVYYQELDFEH